MKAPVPRKGTEPVAVFKPSERHMGELKTQRSAASRGSDTTGAPPSAHVDHSRLHVAFQNLHEVIETAPAVIIFTNAEGVIEYVNPRFCETTGHSFTDVVGRSIRDIAEQTDGNREAWETLMGGKSWQGEIRFVRKDGGERLAEASVHPVRGVNGQIVRYIGIHVEVTDLRRTEAALQESEAYWRALLESIPYYIAVLDREGRITTLNRAAEGANKGDVEGTLSFDYIPAEYHQLWRDALTAVFDRRERRSIEFPAELGPGGPVVWWHTSIGPVDGADGVKAAVSINTDLSERKEIEQALRHSESHLRALLENAPAFIVTVDRDGTITSVNRELRGGTPEGAIGHSVFEFADQTAHQEIHEALDRVFESGEMVDLENRAALTTGEVRWWASTMGPVWDGDEIAGAVMVSLDVTDRREAQERLRAFATAVADLIVVVDSQGVLREVLGGNRAGGFPEIKPDTLRGRRIADFLPPRETELAMAFVKRTIKQARPTEGEMAIDLPGGRVWVHGRSAPLALSSGECVAVVHVTDVSEQKRMEAELQTLREEVESQAEERQAAGSEFGLTFRELTVLGLIARGKSDKEIASLLGVSPFTVNKQSASAVRKLNARSRSEAVATAIRAGII